MRLIVGASGSLGRKLSEQLASQKIPLFLVSSDWRDLTPMQADLKIRFGCHVEIAAFDLGCFENIKKFVCKLNQFSQVITHVYFPQGLSRENDALALNSDEIDQILQVNLGCVLLIVQGLLTKHSDQLCIVIVGSIAQTRGRNGNIVYAAAKRGLTSFFESLKHRSYSHSNLRPFLFQIGYMESQQTFGKRLLFPISTPEKIAEKVLKVSENREVGEYYLPYYWKWICRLLRWMPWKLYRRLNF